MAGPVSVPRAPVTGVHPFNMGKMPMPPQGTMEKARDEPGRAQTKHSNGATPVRQGSGLSFSCHAEEYMFLLQAETRKMTRSKVNVRYPPMWREGKPRLSRKPVRWVSR